MPAHNENAIGRCPQAEVVRFLHLAPLYIEDRPGVRNGRAWVGLSPWFDFGLRLARPLRKGHRVRAIGARL